MIQLSVQCFWILFNNASFWLFGTLSIQFIILPGYAHQGRINLFLDQPPLKHLPLNEDIS